MTAATTAASSRPSSAAIDERTRAVVISHVLWSTGAVMPVRAHRRPGPRPGRARHRRWRPVGRRHPGRRRTASARMPTPSPARSGCSARKAPGRSPSRPPAATGSGRARPAGSPSSGSTRRATLRSGRPRGATRARASTAPRSSVFARSIGWLSMFVGLPWMHERAARMTRRAWDRLTAIDGVESSPPRCTWRRSCRSASGAGRPRR